jgi:hypothetical protein
MKITKQRLNEIIQEELFYLVTEIGVLPAHDLGPNDESSRAPDINQELVNATVMAATHVEADSSGLSQKYHSWIILYDENGQIDTWLSGKSSTSPTSRAVVSRIINGRKQTDAIINSCRSSSFENANKTMWGALQKFERWNEDYPHTAEMKWLIQVPGTSRLEIQNRIRNSFNNYNNDSPYDLLPNRDSIWDNLSKWRIGLAINLFSDSNNNPIAGTGLEWCGRNSNSFAMSLLRAAGVRRGSHIPIEGTGLFNPSNFPGGGQHVKGM